MTTHIFIVGAITFKIHLEYLFSGTGAKENVIDFNDCPNSSLNSAAERILIGMIADGGRIRRGDQIIFYLQQDYKKEIFEGKFFGIFKAKMNGCFLDNNDKQQYLKGELEKSLTFRTLIEPYKVYEEGVTEWEALDEIKNINSPTQMLWSLIYRKLKGNRGNTMITIYEAERLTQLLRNKNNRVELDCNDKNISFDSETQRIICLDKRPNSYRGQEEEINILPRLIAKYREGKAFEVHVQSYITKNLGMRINRELDDTLLDGAKIEWLGNEVSCGVGMQKIDILSSVTQNEQRILIAIELKAIAADTSNIIQITRYIDWIEQYYIPNHQSDIQPVLLAQRIADKQSVNYQRLIDSFSKFNIANNDRCMKLKYIEFNLDDDKLSFETVLY